MRIQIVAVGRKMPAWVDTAFDEYAKRFPRQKKIVLKVQDEQELMGIVHKARQLKINNCYIRDAGLTQVAIP